MVAGSKGTARKKLNARTAHQLTAGQVVRLGGALGGPVHGRRRRCEPWGQRRKGGAIALDDAREYVAGGSAVHEAVAVGEGHLAREHLMRGRGLGRERWWGGKRAFKKATAVRVRIPRSNSRSGHNRTREGTRERRAARPILSALRAVRGYLAQASTSYRVMARLKTSDAGETGASPLRTSGAVQFTAAAPILARCAGVTPLEANSRSASLTTYLG